MRVIGGWLGSRTLQAPPGLATRPTSDRLRETLFNVLAPRMEGAAFLDLYAGSGAVGIEALSRGAARVVFVERAAPALKVLRMNLERLAIKERFEIYPGAVSAFLRRGTPGAGFDVVFLDPPYDAEAEYAAALGLLGGAAFALLNRGALLIAEHRRKEKLNESCGALARTRLLEQGDAALSFYSIAVKKFEEQDGQE
jgi:16S rRNA (guanine966-N2)-methyltransferase